MSNALPQKPSTTTVPANETERLVALHRYKVLDTPPEVAFDRITTLAARLFNMPIALISLVDESRAWFKSRVGFEAREVSRYDTLCSFAVLIDEPLIIPDTRLDDRFACNPFVQAEPGVRFYAGAPLLTDDGFNLGTLCLLDTQPRDPLTPEQQATLADLAAMVVDELELRLAAHQTARSEEKYRTLFESIDEGFCICEMLFDQTGKPYDYQFLEANSVFAQLTGLEDAVGKTARQLVPNLEDHWVEIYGKVVQTGKAVRFEQQSIAMSRWFDVNAFPIGEPQSKQFGILFTNITNRKKAEQERERFFAVSSDLQVITGNNGYFQWVSPAFERILGWTQEEMISHPWTQFVHPDDINASVSEATDLFSGNETFQFENRYRHKDGSYRWFLWNAQPNLEEQVLYGAAIDITDRKQAEAMLRSSHDTFRHLVENSPFGVYTVDADFRLAQVSSGAQKVFENVRPLNGRDFAEVLRIIWSEPFASETIARFRHTLETGEPYHAPSIVEHRSDIGEVESYDWKIERITLPDGRFGVVCHFYDLSERQRYESALRASEERTRLAIGIAQLGTWRYNLDTNFVELDERMREIWGKSKDTMMIALPQVIEQIHPDDQARVELAVGAALNPKSPGTYAIEYRIVRDDGSERWVFANGQAQFAGEGASRRAIQFIGTALDITERKQVEAALRESEERLRTLTATIPQLIWTALPDGSVDYLSEQWADHIGLPPERLYDWNWQQVVHPGDLPNTLRDWEHSLQFGEPLEIQHRFRYRTGEWRWQLVRGIPIKDGMGQVTKWVGTCTDIQSEVDIKTALQASEEQSRNILARERHYVNQLQGLTTAALAINSALSVEEVLQVITDQAASIIGAHQSVTSMTINQNWAQAINAVYLSDKYAQWRDYDEQTDGSGIYACVCHANRSIRMTQAELEAHPHWKGFGNSVDRHPPMRGWLAAPLIGRDGHNIGLIQLSDKYEGEFTEADESILIQLAQMASVAVENARLYEAEQQARSTAESAREEAQAANRVKDEFLAVLSHELRSPLNPILGWTRLLQNGKLDETRQCEALATIERNAKLQTQLIEDLLDISRIMQGKLSLTAAPVSLTFVITAAVETVRLAAEAKQIQILLDLTTATVPVTGDAARLQQVVWNLLTNAVKFTPSGGRVTVELRQLDQLAQIRVTDTGKGISDDFLPYVFEYFRQADSTTTRRFGGLGLGLAIVRHLVELHGGTVKVESLGENQGATFTVQLPLMQQTISTVLEPTHVEADNQETPLSNLQILVVDDDDDTREFQAFLLNQCGARVTVVASGLEALQALDQFIPDVLVSDIGMPEMDGYRLMQQIRSRPANQGGRVPAIALTAYARDFDQQKALQAGFQRHLSKPVEPETLVRTVVALVQRDGSESQEGNN